MVRVAWYNDSIISDLLLWHSMYHGIYEDFVTMILLGWRMLLRRLLRRMMTRRLVVLRRSLMVLLIVTMVSSSVVSSLTMSMLVSSNMLMMPPRVVILKRGAPMIHLSPTLLCLVVFGDF